jgi:RNA polymerase sigma-70 factor (ECF subfamily)
MAGATGDTVKTLADRDAVATALERLSNEHRSVIVLRYYVGLSQPEIANAIGEPQGTVKSRLSRAISYLRADLDAAERAPIAGEGSA